MSNVNTLPAASLCHVDKGPPYEQPANQQQAKANFKYYRKKAGYSQTNIAKCFDLKPAAVNRWESLKVDGFIPLDRVDALAKLLHIEPKALRVYREDYETLYSSGAALITDPYSGAPVPFTNNPTELADYKNNMRYLRIKHGYTQKDLGHALGLSHSIASSWENLDNSVLPSREHIERLAVFYSVESRLIAPPIETVTPANQFDNTSYKPAAITAARVQGRVDQDANRIYSSKSNVALISMIAPNDDILNMRARTSDSAGPVFPSELQFDASVSELLGINYTKGLAAAKVIGDSMFNPETGAGIPDGAIVLIDTTKRDISSALGKVVCFCVDGCYFIKRLRSNHGVLNAVSDNHHYFPLFYENVDDINLIGEVVGILLSIE